MKSRFHKIKMKLFCKISNPYSIMFHVVGLACLIWFVVRVLPKPDRIYYPCQQMSITVASSYFIFWSIVMSALFHGTALWIKRAKHKTTAFLPVLLVSFVLVFSITSGVFGNKDNENTSWEPIPNEPIGTPLGANPGRVTWVWDPDATESNLNGYWWKKQNNNQEVIDDMYSRGIQGLAGVENDEDAWDILFKYFNQVHGKGEVGYQPGEKIAIKVNLNNCYTVLDYFAVDNNRDASPYVVKGLLHQLVEKVGVAQEDIIVYDASRPIPIWFYNRVYYKTYPAFPKVPEFPNIHYADSKGLLPGREKVQPSSEKIYFADGLDRTLPICVVDAKYIINMPLLKRHPINTGVTLSGKNLFGTWIEPVWDVHAYHQSAFTLGNPTPQTDLLAHEHIGGKTLLYVGDGTFATKIDHSTIDKFQMYPFNNDWTNSLFFSQDPVAIDSVMYDFLHTEGTNPCEGSQNYLHQSAEPLADTYDPENDGTFLSESLGVHEHWDKTTDIFSSDRYLGPSEDGIDFVAINGDADPEVVITKPKEGYLYISGSPRISLPATIIIGDIDVEAEVKGESIVVEKIEFYINDNLVDTVDKEPYYWTWVGGPKLRNNLKVVAYYDGSKTLEDRISVWKFG